jgi:hypothetical protein
MELGEMEQVSGAAEHLDLLRAALPVEMMSP